MRTVSERQTISPVLALLLEAAALGDDASVSNILSLMTVAEASQPDPRTMSPTYGLTALHRAKTPEVARVLINFGVPINCRGPLGQTPLHTCCDNSPVVKLLIERGADIGATTSDGSTALEWAVVADSVESVMLLLEKGANVQTANKNGNTPLHLVSSRKMTELLLAHGAKVSVENNEGKIPLETAAERQGEPDFASITELLLDVSEDRGLRFRNKKTSVRTPKSSDSFGEAADRTERVRKRWSMVRDKFLTHKNKDGAQENPHPPMISQAGKRHSLLDVIGAARKRSGTMTKEWHNEETMAAVEADSATNGNSSFVDSRLEGLSDDDEEDAESTTKSVDEEEKGEHSGFYMRFFELAIRERPFLAKKMLDRHRTFLYAKGTAKYYLYDLSLLGGVDSVSDALRLIVENDRRELVSHDVVQWLITAKWGLFTQKFVLREALLYFLFIVLFTMSTLNEFFSPFVTSYRLLADFGLFILSNRYLARLALEWYHRGRTMAVAQSIFRADRFTGPVFVIMLAVLFGRYVVGFKEHSSFERVLETMGCVMLWIRVLYFAEAQFRLVGLTMSIVRRMIADIAVYVCVQFVFLIGFAHAMTVAMRGSKPLDPNFGTPSKSFASLFFFIFNPDTDTVYDLEDPERRLVAMLLLAMYLSLVVVLFLNLVIAVMTTSFEEVMSNAKSEWLLVRAKICVRMEDQTSSVIFATNAKRHILRARAKRTAIVMERANGENEVALPVSLRPPSVFYSEMFVIFAIKLKDFLVRKRHEHRHGYQPIGPAEDHEQPRIQRQGTSGGSNSPRMLKQGSRGTLADAFIGQAEEVFVVGTFIRSSVLNAPSSSEHAQQPQSVQSLHSASPPPGWQKSVSNEALSDEQLISSLQSILKELERRKAQSSNDSHQSTAPDI